MPSHKSQHVWLRGIHIGEISSQRRDQISFQYSPEILDQFSMNTPVLSCSLPVSTRKVNAQAFFAGLLPEGEALRFLAQHAKCLSTDIFQLLNHFGQDVAGAVIIGESVATRPPAQVINYDPDALVAEVAELPARPLAFYNDSELSIAGLQNKMLLVKVDETTWGRPVHGFPSTHILKRDDASHPGLVRAENMCLNIARAAGIPAAISHVEQFGNLDCIIVERFDRIKNDGDWYQRVHQEDACQALGINTQSHGGQAKYESHGGPSFKQVANLLIQYSDDFEQELTLLLEQMVFTVAIGNADAHGKNISLCHSKTGSVTLAPLYDTVPTVLWPTLRDRAAMSIRAAVDLPDITSQDLINEARRWGLPESLVSERLTQTVEGIIDACDVVADSGELPVTTTVRDRAKKLMT